MKGEVTFFEFVLCLSHIFVEAMLVLLLLLEHVIACALDHVAQPQFPVAVVGAA